MNEKTILIIGGECIGWDRKGYHIDGVEIFHPESFNTFIHEEGPVSFYRNIERMRSSWKELSPEDGRIVDEFCDTLGKLHSFEVPTEKPMDLMSIPEKIKLMLSMKDAGMVMKKYGKVPIEEYGRKFRHPALRAAFESIMPEGYSVSAILFALATFNRGNASIPKGGSKAFSQRMLQRYLQLGGEIETSCEVVSLKKEKRVVRRLVCKNGKTFTGDYVIRACDPNILYDRLLEGAYSDPVYEKRYAEPGTRLIGRIDWERRYRLMRPMWPTPRRSGPFVLQGTRGSKV